MYTWSMNIIIIIKININNVIAYVLKNTKKKSKRYPHSTQLNSIISHALRQYFIKDFWNEREKKYKRIGKHAKPYHVIDCVLIHTN